MMAWLPKLFSGWGGVRVRTPTVIQMEAVECGAASLAIILGYYRRFVPLEALRRDCGVSRDGSKAGNILKAGRNYGLEASGVRADAATVLKGPFPMMLFWSYSHFLVIEGVGGETVYLNDPAFGPRKVTLEEFIRSYSGIALSFKPSADFVPGGTRPSIFMAVLRRFNGLGRTFLFMLGVSLLLAVPAVTVPGFIKIFVDDLLIGHSWNWLGPLLVCMAGALVMRVILTWIQQMLLLRMEFRFALVQSARFVWHVLRLPIHFFDQRYVGDISSRIDSNDNVASLIAGEFGGSMLDMVIALFFITVMLFYDVALTLIVVVVSVGNALILRWVQRARADGVLRLKTEQARLFSTSIVGLQSIETIKASGSENDNFAKWAGYHAGVINTEQKLAFYEQVTVVVPTLLSSLAVTGVIGLGGLRVMNGYLTLGELIAFQTLFFGVAGPIERATHVVAKVQEVWGDMVRLDDVFEHKHDRRHMMAEQMAAEEMVEHQASAGSTKVRSIEVSDHAGALTLEEIDFGYAILEPPLLTDLSLHLEPGHWVALVGRSGSGKSTVTKLLSGLYEPWGGDILIDGRPLVDYHRHEIAGILAVVDQDSFAFEGTIRDNITLWDDTVPQHVISEAARDADLLELIETFNDGYDSFVREGGENLSGGQRQRLAIARALASEPAILVLDEATSALDTVTEKKVADAIRRRGYTCVIVAHRLSTIRDCDEIIVLDQGSVVERGDHDTLMELDGYYASLVTSE